MTDRADEIAREFCDLMNCTLGDDCEGLNSHGTGPCPECVKDFRAMVEPIRAYGDERNALAARVQELEGHAELYRELAARVDDDEDSLVAENTRLREALEEGEAMTDLKPCPFCGGEATVRDGKCEGGFILEHHNRTTDPDCLILGNRAQIVKRVRQSILPGLRVGCRRLRGKITRARRLL